MREHWKAVPKWIASALLTVAAVAGATVAVVQVGARLFSKDDKFENIDKRVPVEPARAAEIYCPPPF